MTSMIRRLRVTHAPRQLASRDAVWRDRLATLAAALDRPDSESRTFSQATAAADVAAVVDLAQPGQVWLALAVMTGRLPDERTVIELVRECEFDGGAPLWRAIAEATTDESAAWRVRVARSEVLADVAHTASTVLTTGIQRVARETVRRWMRDHDCTGVSWSPRFQSLRELTAAEQQRIERAEATDVDDAGTVTTVVVPWRATYLLPELAAEPERTEPLRALARFAGCTTGVIGFDCVPITSAETTQLGFSGLFTANLAAVRSFDRVATISQAARTEYLGWAATLAAIGLPGPSIQAVQLPVEAAPSTTADLAAARDRFVVGNLPLVLVVGSHEPRKNHVAVLHAAELLWRQGVKFSLSFVGGNSWGSEGFARRLAELQQIGRPVDSVSRLTDAHLWAAYRLARCTVFPSLNEGFGLPVAESLAVGTPVITSGFGSMLEIASGGGAVTVDPRSDGEIADGLRRVLTDDALHARLVAEATVRPERLWDDYATGTWDFLVRGIG